MTTESTREQDNAVDTLTRTHGRVLVVGGYADHNLRVTCPRGQHFHVTEDGFVREAGVDFSDRYRAFILDAEGR